jgi:hypothetical protein
VAFGRHVVKISGAGDFCNGVKSVVLCNRRLPVNFRSTSLATEIARRRNMTRWGQQATFDRHRN